MKHPLEVSRQYKRMYAVGDIHGCADELSVLLSFLRKSENISGDDFIVFIGDYIDRGPKSREVLDLLVDFRKEAASAHFLQGNHEDMLLAFLGMEGSEGQAWLINGGEKTLSSYGVDTALTEEDLSRELLKIMPPAHLQFLKDLESYIITPDFVFAHAGVNPLRDVRFQKDSELFWIRDEFINNIHYFKKTVVFGHTPFEDILFHLPYKIGIDTGCVYGNKLSCVELLGKKYHQIRKGGAEVVTNRFR